MGIEIRSSGLRARLLPDPSGTQLSKKVEPQLRHYKWAYCRAERASAVMIAVCWGVTFYSRSSWYCAVWYSTGDVILYSVVQS
jgi:hypothetical protein